MKVSDCQVGRAVIFRETGKPATITRVDRGRNRVEIVFPNGSTATADALALLPADVGSTAKAGPSKSCQRCGASMPLAAKICPECGHGGRVPRRRRRRLMVAFIILDVIVTGLLIWFLLFR